MSTEQETRRERVDAVIQIVKDVHYKTEAEREEAILTFVKANLSLEEIDSLVQPLRPNYLSKEDQWQEIERQWKERHRQ